ncbi:protease [Chryseotalea sanaruensis]|uniref:Protease n=1 Tax=Chryseotalea sanaruensis TaxID=2482724 RepID=A0A401UC30_9BACT|nr:M57 family metalloprotease [Chryseotalea sanaruensis]GCC52437.1 protease [Chryseotalea sanaruensis]
MMKKVLSIAALAAAIVMVSCQQDESLISQEVSQVTLDKISALGFGTQDVQRVDGGYLVEGDIVLHEHDLEGAKVKRHLNVGQAEQYRTTNLVSGPRTITVSVSGNVPAGFSNSVNNALARYNAENIGLTFTRVASGGNINIRIVNTRQYIASAGFPSGGNPYNEIKYAKTYTNYSDGFMTTVVAHEIGHCIGFRHTDYMDRSYSCGGSTANEGASSVGAIHIPGTPTTADPGSWMLACLSASTNRPFNNNDKTALSYLY